MAKKRKPTDYLSLFTNITSQELQIGSSGNGSDKYPLIIGTYIELVAKLEEPMRGASILNLSVSEAQDGLRELTHIGMVHRVKPEMYAHVWASKEAVDRLIPLIASGRLTDLYITMEVPRYGKAWVINWAVRTSPELE